MEEETRHGILCPKKVTKKQETSRGGLTKVYGIGVLLKILGIKLTWPGLCSIVKSKSVMDNHQRVFLNCCGLINVNHFKFAWSIIIFI